MYQNNLIHRVVEHDETVGLQEKLDFFYAAGRLSETEYTELTGALRGE